METKVTEIVMYRKMECTVGERKDGKVILLPLPPNNVNIKSYSITEQEYKELKGDNYIAN